MRYMLAELSALLGVLIGGGLVVAMNWVLEALL